MDNCNENQFILRNEMKYNKNVQRSFPFVTTAQIADVDPLNFHDCELLFHSLKNKLSVQLKNNN